MVNLHRRLVLALVLSVPLGTGVSAASAGLPGPLTGQAPGAANADSSKCPLRAPDLDKLSTYRWKFGRYQANRVYTPAIAFAIRVDVCELLGMDDKGTLQTSVTVNIAGGPHAAAFAKYWRDVCAGSIQAEARGKVQPLPGVTGGYQCVTPNGRSSNYWIESAGRTIQLEPGNDSVEQLLPKLLAAVR